MAGLDDYQWKTVLESLKKIDDLSKAAHETKTDVALLKAAIMGNGSIGIKDQIKEIETEVKKKVSYSHCQKMHENLERRKKTALDWFKGAVPWVIAIVFGILSYIK